MTSRLCWVRGGAARDTALRLEGTHRLCQPPGEPSRHQEGKAGLLAPERTPPCAPCRCPAPSPLRLWLPSLKGQQAGSARPASRGAWWWGGRALTPLLPQVLRVLPHPQLRLHTGFRLVQDVLSRAQRHVQKAHLGLGQTYTFHPCNWSGVRLQPKGTPAPRAQEQGQPGDRDTGPERERAAGERPAQTGR